MKYIVCNLNLFSYDNPVSVCCEEDNSFTTIAMANIDKLPEVIAAACLQEGTNSVKLFGNRQFAAEMAEAVVELAKRNYSNFEIEVEVN